MTVWKSILLAATILILIWGPVMCAKDSPHEALVREFYRHVIAHHPLGIPDGEAKRLLWPLMTSRLTRILETAAVCEEDYFRQNTCTDCKPEFWWLEDGLFSGGNENALPAEVEIVKIRAKRSRSYQVTLRFTYRETFATYGRPPDPANTYQWNGMAIVDCSSGRCLFDDFIRLDPKTGKPFLTLSTAFTDCRDGKWIGPR